MSRLAAGIPEFTYRKGYDVKVKSKNLPDGNVDVTMTMPLDAALAIAALLANVGDRTAGPLVGLYDAIGDELEYTKSGERTTYSLYDAVNRKQDFVRTFVQASVEYLTRTAN